MGDQSADPDVAHEWCLRCNDLVVITDEFEDVIQEYAGQRGVRVTELECGHNLTVPDGTFYPFP